ncbi:MAG: DUF2298 domain-containing protein, partial [Dehalococcoidia bacterium]
MEDGLLAVGAPATVGGGKVYVYVGRDSRWDLQSEISEYGLPASARFGAALALHYHTLAITAPGEGAVYVFDLYGGMWTLSTRLTPERLTPVSGFGRSVDAGLDRVAVGADGAAFVFHRVESEWDYGRIVIPPRRSARESFGNAVAIQDPLLIVGAKSNSFSGYRSGTAFVFKRDGEAWRLETELTAEDTKADSFFGESLAAYGAAVAVGATGNGQGAAYVFERSAGKWGLGSKLVARWRFARALLAGALLTLAAILLASPFLLGFESNASGVLPLRGLMTRPLHLLLVWGAFAVLVLPLLLITLRRVLRPGNWSLMRLGVAAFIGFVPVILWLQPIWGIPFYLTALLLNGFIIFLFGLHRAGYRLPKVDEMSLAFNSGFTRVVGTSVLLALLLWDGVINGERGVDGQYLAIDRLLIVVPMAIIIALSVFGAWTLAYRDSEYRRRATRNREGRARNDGFVPVLLLFAFAAALVMGVELFHVTDVFQGELRRMNTVFKAYYQAWILMSVLGGFALWYISGKLSTR